jgi:hypothetical protein
LRGDFESFFDQFIGNEFFSKTIEPSRTLSAQGYFPSELLRLWLSLDCHVSGLSVFEVLSGRPFSHHPPIGLQASAALNPIADKKMLDDNPLNAVFSGKGSFMDARKILTNDFILGKPFSDSAHLQAKSFSPAEDNTARDTIGFRNFRKTLSGFMPLSQIIQINCYDFSGHVYDLQTVSSLYQINGIVTSNCRGVYVPITKSWRDFGIDMDDLEQVTRPWVMREPGAIGTGGRKIEEFGQTTENFSGWWESLSAAQRAKTSIGPVRGKLLESGAVKWNDLWDKKTGLPYTLEQLGYDGRGNKLK